MDLLSDLNVEQRQAVLHDKGPVLVVAGAGTGKTAVITRRIAHLILTKKARADQILALTFTDKAAGEMEERVDRLLPYGVVTTRIMTFHAFGDQILKRYAIDLGMGLNYQLMTSAQQTVWLRDHLDLLGLDYYSPVGSPDSYLMALGQYFGRLKDELVDRRQYLRYSRKLMKQVRTEAERQAAAKQLELARAYDTYVKLTRREGWLDFGDQIMLTSELFRTRLNVLAEVKAGIKYILVDEFQDTNPAQNFLLQQLAGGRGNLMVVGDDDQSIYKFRGAAISNILAFRRTYKTSKQIVLVQNYRSSQEILDASYRLIQHNNPDRLEFINQIDKRLVGQKSGPAPSVKAESNLALEAEWIVTDITRRLDEGAVASEIAVLVRKNNQAELVLEALKAHRVSYNFSGQVKLYEQTQIKILLHFLHHLTNPNDSKSLYHLLASEVFSADIAELSSLAGLAQRRNQSLESLARERGKDDDSFGQFLAVFFVQLERWRELAREFSVGHLAYDFLSETRYLDSLVRRSKIELALESKVQDMARYFATLKEYEAVAEDRTAYGYAVHFQALAAAGGEGISEIDKSEREVQVLTIHKAKGLEFETVYLFDMTKGAFPGPNRGDAIMMPDDLLSEEALPAGDWHLQEERRLAYVAMTRAKTNLIMTYSPDHGGKTAKQPSPFVREAVGRELPQAEPGSFETATRQIELFKYEPPKVQDLLRGFYQGEKLILTPHQIDDYITCPENFYYLYVLRVPQMSNPNLMYGNLIHAVINYYFNLKERHEVELAELLKLVEELWRREDFVSIGAERRRLTQARQTVTRFYAREQAAKWRPSEVEQEFEFELEAAKVGVKGRFDAVYTKPKLQIRDYKTSLVEDQKKADKKAKDNRQLAIYALAWQKMTGNIPAEVVLDFVETGILGTAVKSEADLAATEVEIETVASGIRSGQFERGVSCRYCSHPTEADYARR